MYTHTCFIHSTPKKRSRQAISGVLNVFLDLCPWARTSSDQTLRGVRSMQDILAGWFSGYPSWGPQS